MLKVLDKMSDGEIDAHLGYEKNSIEGNNSGNSHKSSYSKKIQSDHGGRTSYPFPMTVTPV